MLLSEQLDAAWICGFPLVQHPNELALVAVPVWQGKPLYRSYIIAGVDDPVESFIDMRGYVHAFSDPDSNSGFLVTRHLLTTMQEKPETFFSRFFFTYGHRNVIRAVAAGLGAMRQRRRLCLGSGPRDRTGADGANTCCPQVGTPGFSARRLQCPTAKELIRSSRSGRARDDEYARKMAANCCPRCGSMASRPAT